jgi:hypothetical protein
MPTSLPPRESPPAAILIQIARSYVAVGFFAIAIGLLWVHLIPAARAVARIGKRVGG